tara:strand:+ start:67 stop:849 length:783 start_codon:yes stop_codon:yes gene_type:complete
MNYFFFLNHPDPDLESSIELFNRPPMDIFTNEEKKEKNIYLFYIEDQKWKNEFFTKIQFNKSILIKKSDLPLNLKDKSVFVSMTERSLNNDQPPYNDNSMNSIPAWRSNIKISSKFTSTSYQGEIPGSFLNLNLSLTSCSPFLQFGENKENYFYLINLNSVPEEKQFKLEILNKNKKLIKSIICKTNHVNVFNLDFLKQLDDDFMYIFRSKDFGGIPLYFARTKDNKSFSLEHTHPPQEYLFLGDRNLYQKKKKSFWLNE